MSLHVPITESTFPTVAVTLPGRLPMNLLHQIRDNSNQPMRNHWNHAVCCVMHWGNISQKLRNHDNDNVSNYWTFPLFPNTDFSNLLPPSMLSLACHYVNFHFITSVHQTILKQGLHCSTAIISAITFVSFCQAQTGFSNQLQSP